jgi:nucleotidyltransferase substrate binding protein (TIGR01987 family)
MAKQKRWQERLGEFEKAVKRLEESLGKKKFTDLEKDGIIQRFEFSFELAWKTLKDYLQDQGFSDAVSPKKSLKQAFANNLFDKGDLWIEMLEDRNRLSHLYDQKMSESFFNNIKNKYSTALRDLIKTLKKE